MKQTISTVIATLVILIAGFLIYITSGSYDVSQTTPHNSLTKWIIKQTTHSSINNRMKEITVPVGLSDTSLVIEGFKHYESMCTSCHGAPGMRPWEMVEGLYPKPPKIYEHAKEDEAQEFFWIIKNGIKMTSMPAYGPTHDDQRIWAITAFVTQKLNKMTPEEYREWQKKYAENESDEGKDVKEGVKETEDKD